MFTKIKRYIKEPLIHFLVFGGLIFLYYHLSDQKYEEAESYDILIDKRNISHLKTTYQLNWNKEPDQETLDELIEEEILTEIYLREAKRLNMHQDDEIIRRRLKQKFEFLLADISTNITPTRDDLENYYKQNQNKFLSEKKISFRHFYYSYENKNVQPDLESLSSDIKTPDNHENSNFHIPSIQSNKDKFDINRTFGNAFAEAIFAIDKTGWLRNDIKSGFGNHLVYIEGIESSTVIPYEKAENRIRKKWMMDQQQKANAQIKEELLAKYNVVIDPLK